MKKVTIEHIPSVPIGTLSTLQPGELAVLLSQAQDNLLKAKKIKEFIEGAITIKYEERAKHARKTACKETGTIHFNDSGFTITSEIKKKVSWSQSALERVVRYFTQKGEDPTEYIDITYNISETRYKELPDNMQKFFTAARTLSGGKETFKIELKNGVVK